MKIEWIDKYLKEADELIMNHEVERALDLMNNLLYSEPGYAELHNYLGWAYLYYTGEPSKATLHFNMAIRFDPQYQAPYLHLATLSMREQKYADALGYAEQGLTKPQANKPALFEIIGNVHELRGEFRKAIKSYKAASLNSLGSFETENYQNGIKRCRKKQVTFLFTF